jgi:2-oxoglutarate ferredoxin oxidoreductase subunit gamma
MSQEAYAIFAHQVREDGILVIEQDMVRVDNLPPGVRVYSCPATRLAEELGKKMVLNIVMVGFFGAVSGLLKPDSLRDAVAASVPEAYRDLNRKAFDKGYEYGLKILNGEIPAEEPQIEVAALEN